MQTRFLNGWRAIVLIASTYVYFLIFAQFGFLKRLQELGIAGDSLKPVMGAMAVGGIFASLFGARLLSRQEPRRRLQLAFAGCGLAALLAVLRLNVVGALAVATLIGLALGVLTVTLVVHLPLWIGEGHPLYKVALGTGLGYLVCNYPPLFTANPQTIACCAVVVCVIGALVVNRKNAWPVVNAIPIAASAFVLVLLWFTALVWLDSAAFFIIQNSPVLKSGTWQGAGHLWRIGGLHFIAALAGAWLLNRLGVAATLLIAFTALASACLLLLNPSQANAAGLFYPVGVSIYSVVLVAYPSFLMTSQSASVRSRQAGIIYAVAGWIGSAMGIGMAQNLHHVPPAFVAAAAVLFLLPFVWRGYRKEALAVVTVAALALGVAHLLPRPAKETQMQGRGVYISEGCINCHSQYVRPHSRDVEMWGPSGDLDAIRRQKPPLIGNRRQGPDLSEVGSRRSPLWLRIHLMNPRDLNTDSVMPQYSYLFQDGRGDALVTYLSSLRTRDSSEHLHRVMTTWQLAPAAMRAAEHIDGKRLFETHCATCHTAAGRVRTKWSAAFKRLPPELSSVELSRIEIARIAKFGLPGTDMPGHEYLPDQQVDAIAHYVAQMHATNGKQ